MSDGGLRQLFQGAMSTVHWQSIETWSTGKGVPDLNGCSMGIEFWIELKLASANAVVIAPEQVAWAERRLRSRGRVFLAVRRKASDGKRRPGYDELWLFHGSTTRTIMMQGLSSAPPLCVTRGGPAKWDWAKIFSELTK
jgi:hypothetical protein